MTRNHQHHCPMGVQKPPYPRQRKCLKRSNDSTEMIHAPQLRKTNWSQNPQIQWTIMKTSWKHHENIMETSWKHHENILQLKIPNLCLGSKICVGRVRMRVCEVPQNDMHYRMMVELMNWYVMVSCHVMLQKTPALVFPSTFPAPIRCRCDGATFSFCEPRHSGIRRDLMGYDGMVIGC